jgi:hypothetical protein
MSEVPQFDEGIVTDSKPQSSGSDGSGPSIPEVRESVARLVIDAIQQKGGLIEVPAFKDSADALPESYAEYYDLDDVETLSVEELFGQDWGDYDYIGTPPVVASEKLTDDEKDELTDDQRYKSDGDEKKYVIKPEYAEAFDGTNVLKGGTTPISKALNGRFSELIVEAFGDDSKISVGKGKSRNHEGDSVEAQKYVAFWVSDSETAPLKRQKARMQVGDISESEFHEWKEANGFAEDDE